MFESSSNSYLFPFFHHRDTERDEIAQRRKPLFLPSQKKEILLSVQSQPLRVSVVKKEK